MREVMSAQMLEADVVWEANCCCDCDGYRPNTFRGDFEG